MEKKRLIDILNRTAARSPNPPSVYGCCCRRDDAGGWQKEDNVEWDQCRSPAWFHPNKECSKVRCGYPDKNIKQPSEMLSVAGKQGDNAPILSGPSDTEPVTRFAVTPSCLPYNCPPVPNNYNPAASTQYYQWVNTWNTLMFNWNNPEWAINRVALYNILRDQYLQAFAPGIDPDKAWPPYNNLGI